MTCDFTGGPSGKGGPEVLHPAVQERWRDSVLSRDAVRKLLEETVGYPLANDPAEATRLEALYLTLKVVTDDLITYSRRPPLPSLAQGRAVRNAATKLREAIEATSTTRHPAPRLPDGYAEQLQSWVEAYAESMFGPGREQRVDDRRALGLLLVFYELAFDRKPSASVGPTHRFIEGYCTLLRATEAARQPPGPNGFWRERSPSALKLAIGKSLKWLNGERPRVQRALREELAFLHRLGLR